jgi:CRISPR-associated protein Csm5
METEKQTTVSMVKSMEKYLLKITTLSPIHIGSGEKANGLSYIKDSTQIHLVEFDVLKESFSIEEMGEFEAWIDEQSSLISKLEEKKRNVRGNKQREDEVNRELRQARESFSLTTFINDVLKKKEILQEMLKHSRCYAVPNKSRIGDNQDIELFIKQPDFKVYIPGGEIKGAIRTAVLYNELAKNHLTELENEMESVRSKKGLEEINKWVQALVRDIEETDAHYDLFRFLQVSDSDYKSPVDCLSVNEIKTLGMRPVSIFQEVCNEQVTFSASLNINTNALYKEALFKNTRELLTKSRIVECCHKFTTVLLEEEKKYREFQGNQSLLAKLKQIGKLNEKNSPILRIGKGQGFLSVTVDLLIKNKFPKLYVNNLVPNIGKKVHNAAKFPETRRVAVKNNTYLPLGWVKLELT